MSKEEAEHKVLQELEQLCIYKFPLEATFQECIQNFLEDKQKIFQQFKISRKSKIKFHNFMERWIDDNAPDLLNEFIKANKKFEGSKKSSRIRNPIIFSKKDFEYSNIFDETEKYAFEHFASTKYYSKSEALAWLIFSAAFWDGVKDKEVLQALLDAVIESDPFLTSEQGICNVPRNLAPKNHNLISPFIENTSMVSLVYRSGRGIGIDVIDLNTTWNTQQLVLGNMTRLWLIRLRSIQQNFTVPELPE